MNQNIPKSCNTGNLCIKIDNQTAKIDRINGIKLPYYEHQKVLIQQMINTISQGYLTCDNQKYYTKNIWLKGSIGTGKSLCLLSLIQYYKNKQYQDLILKVPLSMPLLSYIKESDNFFSPQQPFSQKGLYQQIHNINYYNFDMTKQQGYVIGEQGRFIQYPSHRKQSLLFVQQQVYQQFEDYINTQTSLSYTKVNTPISFLNFIFNDSPNDIILWNIDTINIPNIFVMIIDFMKQYSKEYKLNESQLIEKQNFIQKEYGNIQRFNDFWVIYQQLHQNKPFTFICYDDFDMIKLPTGYPIDSLYNIFVGSTMIQRMNEETNVCSNFILNKHINHITGFRVDEQQLQKILKLPPNHIHNIVCSTPSRLYIQFKMMQYLRQVFQLIVDIERGGKTKDGKSQVDCMVFNNQVFNDLTLNKTSFAKLFKELKKYQLIYEHLNYNQDFILDMINNIKMICYGEYIFNSSKFTQEEKEYAVKTNIQPYIYSNIDIVFQQELYQCKKYKEIVNKLMNCQFSIPVQEINQHRLTCPFSNEKNYEILQSDCYITKCCSQPFNRQHLDEVIYYNQGIKYCAFCQSQIDDIEHHIFDTKTQQYIHKKDIVQTNKYREDIYQVDCLSKLQQLYKIIKESIEKKKKVMIIIQDYNLKDSVIQSFYQPDEPKEFTLENIIKYTRQINMFVISSIPIDYNQKHRTEALNYTRYLMRIGKLTPQQGQTYIQQLLQYDFQEENPDIVIVKSLHQIIGANMTYVDRFIFFNVPEQQEEILQIVGRSRRIGRQFNQDIDSYFFYYPLQKMIQLQ